MTAKLTVKRTNVPGTDRPFYLLHDEHGALPLQTACTIEQDNDRQTVTVSFLIDNRRVTIE